MPKGEDIPSISIFSFHWLQTIKKKYVSSSEKKKQIYMKGTHEDLEGCLRAIDELQNYVNFFSRRFVCIQ